MTELLPLADVDQSELIALWNEQLGAEFPMQERLWRQNLLNEKHWQPEASFAAVQGARVVGLVAGKAPLRPTAWPGQAETTGWITACVANSEDVADRLMDRAEQALWSLGLTKLCYGSDPGHFFPGIPNDNPRLAEVLLGRGWTGHNAAIDMKGDLTDFRLPDKAAQRLAAEPNVEVRPCRQGEEAALDAFLKEEFPGRWRHDTRLRLSVESTPEEVILLLDSGRVIGFAHTYHHGSQFIGPPIYWSGALGENFGGLGPIGVASSERKRGLGLALLAEALLILCERGVGPAAIDWTDLVEFYAKVGFRPWRTYTGASKTSAEQNPR